MFSQKRERERYIRAHVCQPNKAVCNVPWYRSQSTEIAVRVQGWNWTPLSNIRQFFSALPFVSIFFSSFYFHCCFSTFGFCCAAQVPFFMLLVPHAPTKIHKILLCIAYPEKKRKSFVFGLAINNLKRGVSHVYTLRVMFECGLCVLRIRKHILVVCCLYVRIRVYTNASKTHMSHGFHIRWLQFNIWLYYLFSKKLMLLFLLLSSSSWQHNNSFNIS